jgi:hypothetical protein
MPSKDAVARIAMWSGPRNISTAMMRAFENRADTAVWDEPLYAHYLMETGLDHPMAADIIATYETDWHAVVARATGAPPAGASIFYQKHMTHHLLPHIGLDWLDRVSNCFLIRDPRRVLASYAEKRAEVTLEDLGFPQQRRVYEALITRGARPPVLDADDVLADPRGMLTALCACIGIPFDEAMLSWPPGRRDSDGLWAAHWYGAVERSTGFMAPTGEFKDVPAHLAPIAEAARPYYEELHGLRLRPA